MVATLVGGSPYTILTRRDLSRTHTRKPPSYAFERFQAMGLSTSYHTWGGDTYRNVITLRPARPNRCQLT